ncbi:NAD(P)/FAD-dependent oxidoreductase [Chengkuizengella axinellae]|uniref:FAD-binding oxidoreductase n=1 Tax=Chengkuizengella axinellae TaxID=3064388 RepID=A0ABT9J120_9BACL|nr:FAD-binding oxidoreductase [Chengkuizengella sp. 2205SS18-9]MDP5274709.1 FAD-binding oxidoreductase [Chengkuizengella sp. 2205SS18-9]
MKRNIVVIGGGVVGASILYQLAKNGYSSSTLLEKNQFASGSTSKSGGFIRIYHTDSYLTELARNSFQTFVNFNEEFDCSCGYIKTGLLNLVPSSRMEKVFYEVEELKKQGCNIEFLSFEEGKERFPSLKWDGIGAAVHEPNGGYADPLLTTRAWIQKGRSLGAMALEGIEVNEIMHTNKKIVGIDTSIGFIQADVVILAAGAWSDKFVKQLGLDYSIRSKHIQIQYFKRPESSSTPPAFIDNVTDLYSKPEQGGLQLIGYPMNEWDINPDESKAIHFNETKRVKEIAEQRFDWMDQSMFSGGRLSFDGYTPHEKGIIEAVPGMDGLILAAGWSGGGFKLSPAIGKRVIRIINSI